MQVYFLQFWVSKIYYFKVLLEKHPKASKASNDVLLLDQNVHPVIQDSTDSEMVRDAIK